MDKVVCYSLLWLVSEQRYVQNTMVSGKRAFTVMVTTLMVLIIFLLSKMFLVKNSTRVSNALRQKFCHMLILKAG